MKIVGKRFYLRDPDKVAKSLLGKILVRKIGNKVLSGKIVETEAYFGKEDPASRACPLNPKYNNPKYVVKALYGELGRSLIYMVHGNWLFNVIAHKRKKVGGVLIRAIEPLKGIEIMLKNRKVKKIFKLTNGPGKWTQAFRINFKQNGIDLTDPKSEIIICKNGEKFEICSSKRIGVWKDLKINLRFFIKGNKFVSK